ncbi:carbohydrate ABC transporter permease [Cohnella sp. GCM10012308]|uniref:carbohydrate ABC transporter permease n=1 Tax=Cohnella sp. GCM10012308 TaxID=3317329 RepID=UPI003620BAF1
MENVQQESRVSLNVNRTIVYIVCIVLALLSILPFWIMFVNATRSTAEIQSGLSLLPSTHMKTNLNVLLSKSFDPLKGFFNSLIISGFSTICAVYFSSLTAYALVAYNWKLRQAFFTFILLVMMIPAQASAIGFYKFMYQLHWTNSLLPLILPAIAAPAIVFFMRQYLLATLSIEMVEAARIDGAGELYTFNRIVLPIMVPAIATQAIFAFVASWNNLFMPLILLTQKDKYTLPIMVSLLKGDIYKTEFGSIYMGLALTALPLFVIYFLLSRYIIAGVALGGVKE